MTNRRITVSCRVCSEEFDSLGDLDAHECDGVVFIAPSKRTSNPIYHTDRTCSQLGETPLERTRSTLDGRYRECEYCRYRHVPALEDAPDEEFLRQTGLGGSVGDGQSTLDGGIRPSSRDRAQVRLWPVFVGFVLGVAILAASVFVGVL
jgi:hypothetical protein